eukprot:scaffold561_cov254-Pinguiococcus_pyrenoidosus.AAC.2
MEWAVGDVVLRDPGGNGPLERSALLYLGRQEGGSLRSTSIGLVRGCYRCWELPWDDRTSSGEMARSFASASSI